MMRLFLFWSLIILINSCSASQSQGSSEPVNANMNYEFAQFENEPMLVTGTTNGSISLLGISFQGSNILLMIPGKIEKYKKLADGQFGLLIGPNMLQLALIKKTKFLKPEFLKKEDTFILAGYYEWEKAYQLQAGTGSYSATPQFATLNATGQRVLLYQYDQPVESQKFGDNSLISTLAGSFVDKDQILSVVVPILKKDKIEEKREFSNIVISNVKFIDKKPDINLLKSIVYTVQKK